MFLQMFYFTCNHVLTDECLFTRLVYLKAVFLWLCRHETVFVNLRRKPDWLFERNPLGLVPILEYKGNVVYESAVCNEFLEETFPGSSTGTRDLLPSCPKERATMRFLLQKFDRVCSLPIYSAGICSVNC